jgi:hypothetical protein
MPLHQPISWQAGLKLEHSPSFFNEGLFFEIKGKGRMV